MMERIDQFQLALEFVIFGFDAEVLKVLFVRDVNTIDSVGWSCAKGYLRQHETFEDAADRILRDHTGLTHFYKEQSSTFRNDGNGRSNSTISIGYFALVNFESINPEYLDVRDAQWFPVVNVPDLGFNQEQLLRNALLRLRYQSSKDLVAFALLPDKFSMRQLLKLYEAIFEKELDKRNFISKVNSLKILTKLDEKDMTSSRKGSYLFTLDRIQRSNVEARFSLNL